MARMAVVALMAAVLFGAGTAAFAEVNGPSPPDSKACAPGSGSKLKTPDTPTSPPTTNGSGNLSNKLSQSNGVLCPPDVDPQMRQPAPETGKMPVIPPPGGSGGNQDVQPK